jgi:hypothetical protein
MQKNPFTYAEKYRKIPLMQKNSINARKCRKIPLIQKKSIMSAS